MRKREGNITVEATIQFEPAHFNRNAQANIPAVWHAEVLNMDDLYDLRDWEHKFAYYDADTRTEALRGLVAELSRRGLHGILRLV